MTGMYPIHNGLQHGVIEVGQDRGIPLNVTLLPQYLQELGYATHAVEVSRATLDTGQECKIITAMPCTRLMLDGVMTFEIIWTLL